MKPKTCPPNRRITTEELECFVDFINENYGGDLLRVHAYLSHTTTLLNFVQEDYFIEKEKQEVCYLLFGMSKCFLKAHIHRQNNL